MNTGGSFLTRSVCKEKIFTREQFTEEQQEIGRTVEEFARHRIRPNKVEIEKYDKELSLQLLHECSELGLLSIDIPDDYDGLGLDKVTSAIVAEKLAIGMCASFATTFGAHTGIGTLPIVFFGNDEQKKRYLPQLGSGEWLAAYALTEPESGSDAISAKTVARLSDDGKHYILNGTKQFITNAEWANVFTTFANVDGDKFTGFIIERDTPGFTIGPEEKKMGVKGSSTCSLYLADAQVPIENVLGEIGKGAAIAFNTLNIGRFKLGAATLGGCKIVLEEALNYASERRQFGQAIRNFDQLKGYFADMAVRIFALDSIVYRTIGLIDQAISDIPNDLQDYNEQVAHAIERYAIEASMVKVFGSESMAMVADLGLQVHGGNGFIEEYPLASVVRDNRIDRIWEGTNEINRQIISGYFLKRALMEELPIREVTKSAVTGIFSKSVDPGDLLSQEKQAFEAARLLTLFTFSEVIGRFGQDLTNRQQISSTLADMFTDLYVLSSSIERFSQHSKDVSDTTWVPLIRVLCAERIPQLLLAARSALAGAIEAVYLSDALSTLRAYETDMLLNTDIFAAKQQIAEHLYENL